MNQIHAMRVFVRVSETESFRRAAQQLDVSNALVTRAIAMLEAHLRTRLINRTTRNLSLTEAGTRYLEGCRALLEELDHPSQWWRIPKATPAVHCAWWHPDRFRSWR